MGMIFSMMLWAPSWGGMLNGLLTLRGAWHKLRTDPVIKFLVAGVTFYGMATFEGPLLSIKAVSALGHYTDWIIGHVHSGALGWNGFMAAGMFYWLVPRLFGTKLHSKSAADFHFWIGTLGILLYAISMWVSGITQGLMWRAETAEGALLYPSFVETLLAIRPMYIMRLVGGTMYLVGFILMIWNLVMTARSGSPKDVTVEVNELPKTPSIAWVDLVFSRSVVMAGLGALVLCLYLVADINTAVLMLVGLLVIAVYAWITWGGGENTQERFPVHTLLEGRPLLFTALTLVAILIGGVVELVPTLMLDRAVPKTGPIATPYTPLELQGRDIYVRDGCYNCHSQMVRPFHSEKLRYGEISTAGEFIYDHPFQWGSKRTGPDLHRVGGKYPYLWHYNHMMDPRSTSPGSNMPAYAWMAERKIDGEDTVIKVKAMKTLGVPYDAFTISNAAQLATTQANEIVAELKASGDVNLDADSEMVAMIAYLQRLGTHPKSTMAPAESAPPAGGP